MSYVAQINDHFITNAFEKYVIIPDGVFTAPSMKCLEVQFTSNHCDYNFSYTIYHCVY